MEMDNEHHEGRKVTRPVPGVLLVVEQTCNGVSARPQASRCAASPRRHIGHTSRGDNKAGGRLWARPSGGRRCAPRRVAPTRRTPVRLRDRALRGTHRRPLTRHYKSVRPLGLVRLAARARLGIRAVEKRCPPVFATTQVSTFGMLKDSRSPSACAMHVAWTRRSSPPPRPGAVSFKVAPDPTPVRHDGYAPAHAFA